MYNCYYHPKTKGSNSCNGCKMPVCADCEGEGGFCPECARKRDAVNQLRQLRGAVEKKKTLASTTARLRMAIRQVAQGRSGLANMVAEATAPEETPAAREEAPVARDAMRTRPLQKAADHSRPAAAELAAARKVAGRRLSGRLTWKYDPDKIAYRAPENLVKSNNKKRGKVKAPKIQGLPEYRGEAEVSLPLVAKLISAALAVFVGVLAYQLFFKAPPEKVAAKPLYTPLSQYERQAVAQTLGKEAPQTKKFINLPDVTLEAPAQPQNTAPVDVYSRDAVQAQAHAVARSVAATTPVYSAPRAHYYGAARTYQAPRVHRSYYGGGASYQAPATRRQPTLAESIRFTGPGAAHGGRARGGSGKIEVIHW